MTLKADHRSNKSHGGYNLEICREDANFQRLGTQFRYDQPNRPRVIFGKPEEGLHQPAYPRTNLRTSQGNGTYLFKLWVYTLARDCKID